MKVSRWAWRVAWATLGGALWIFASPTLAGIAAVSIGEVTFGWGHVLVLVSVAAAWQDMKTNRARDREEQKRDRDEIRAEVRELRNELKDLWAERG